LERRLRERLNALGPAPRTELLHVLLLPDFDRADAIGSCWGNPKTRTLAELLIDCEEGPTLRAVLVGMLRCGSETDALGSDEGGGSGDMSEEKARLPPRWFVVTAWHVHD
jgi:hypothetical protein